MRLKNNKGKVHFIMVAGKDFVQNEMGKYFFEGTYSKKKKKAVASPEVEPEDAPEQG